MITIRGIDPAGVGYEVVAGAVLADVVETTGLAYPASYGENVHGTPRIIALLGASDDEAALLTPTGPAVELSKAADARAVLAWLRQHTEVTEAVGELLGTREGIDEQVPDGAVF
jgi:hypothetical protein